MNKENKKDDRFTLSLQVDDTHMSDILSVTNGWARMAQREALKTGTYIALFEDKKLYWYVEKKVIEDVSEKLLNLYLNEKNRIDDWQERSKNYLIHIKNYTDTLTKTNFTLFENFSLFKFYQHVYSYIEITSFEFHEENFSSFGNALNKKLNDVITSLGYDPETILSPVLLQADGSAITSYEESLGVLALKIYKKGFTLNNIEDLKSEPELGFDFKCIYNNFAWLTAAWSDNGKKEVDIFDELKELIGFTEDLEDVLKKKQELTKNKLRKKVELVSEIMLKSDEYQKKVLEFTLYFIESMRIRLDDTFKMIYYAQGLFKEIAKRLSVEVVDLKYLTPQEIEKHLIENNFPDMELIKERQKFSIVVLENGKWNIYLGEDALKWKEKLPKIEIQNDIKELKGQIAYQKGVVTGKVKIILAPSEMSKMEEGDILVSSRTYPDLLPAMKKAKAFITEHGGLLSHAAIVSRELQIPCIVGISGVVSFLSDGDLVEVDTLKGLVTVLKKNVLS